MRAIFTPEELEEIKRADAEMEARQRQKRCKAAKTTTSRKSYQPGLSEEIKAEIRQRKAKGEYPSEIACEMNLPYEQVRTVYYY